MDVRDFGDKLEPRLRREYLFAVEAARQLVTEKQLATLIQAGNRDAIYQLGVELVEKGLIPNLAGWVQAISTVAQAAAISTLALGGSLTRINEYALRWVREHAAAQVTGIGWDTQMSIRRTVDALIGGVGPTNVDAAARIIRGSIGMLPQHATALLNYEQAMRRAKVPEERIAKNIETYRRRLIAWRADMIARTETMMASHAGLVQGWLASISEGRLGIDVLMKWMVTEDDRLCERCAPMDGKVVAIGGEFIATERGFPDGMPTDDSPGSRRRRKGGLRPGSRRRPLRDPDLDGFTIPLKRIIRVPHPPLHPNCRCTLVLEIPK